jgi:type II secretory pathway pseudopilin PulG
VLATIVLSSLSDARARARDAKRLADINTIRTAMEIYNIDNGMYPPVVWASSYNNSWENLENLLGVDLPVDPLNTSDSNNGNAATTGNHIYGFYARNDNAGCNGQAYLLVVNFESKTDNSPGVQLCNAFRSYGDSVVVGVNRDGTYVQPNFD